MSKKSGKFLKASPKKRKKNKLGTAVIIAVLLFALAAVVFWLGLNWDEIMHHDPTLPQEQTEPQTGAQHESHPADTQDDQSETGVTGETDPQQTQDIPSEPGESSATVVDAYLKEIDGELHLIKVLSDGTEIDAGLVENPEEDEAVATYTVTFMNYDGTILKTETVKSGGNATPPAAPSRTGYIFIGWSGSYNKVTADVTVVAQYQENTPEVVYYTVKFVDYDGTVLKTQAVEKNHAATAPADPVRTGYKFVGWDKAFNKVTGNLTVTAQYEEIPSTDLTITVGNQTVSPGDTVKIIVSLKNNPGIVGMTLKLTYDQSLMTLTAIDKGSALSEMTFTKPMDLSSGCKVLWDAEFVTPEEASNGEILTLTFRISDTAAAGNAMVSFTSVGDIIDNDLMPVDVIFKNGVITIQ